MGELESLRKLREEENNNNNNNNKIYNEGRNPCTSFEMIV